jgi:hypothetical protein
MCFTKILPFDLFLMQECCLRFSRLVLQNFCLGELDLISSFDRCDEFGFGSVCSSCFLMQELKRISFFKKEIEC